MGGGIARYFESVLTDVSPDREIQKNIVSILHDLFWSGSAEFPIERWKHRGGLGEDAARGLHILNTREFVRLSNGGIEAMQEDGLLADYIDSRFRLEVGGGNRALVVGDSLNQSLKRAPALMAEFYRRHSALGLRELLGLFDASDVPAALLDYSRFKEEYKGTPDEEILSEVRKSEETIHLPQIVQTVHTESLYRRISQVSERERSAVGRGFNARRYSDEEEIAWICAEIDSKLEATKELADFWCDRLEMVALYCNFARYRIWLISPEGFTVEALDSMGSRNAIGSSRKQAELLREYLKGGTGHAGEHQPEEYEIVVPMGDETERQTSQDGPQIHQSDQDRARRGLYKCYGTQPQPGPEDLPEVRFRRRKDNHHHIEPWAAPRRPANGCRRADRRPPRLGPGPHAPPHG
jgi:hypothetical protein